MEHPGFECDFHLAARIAEEVSGKVEREPGFIHGRVDQVGSKDDGRKGAARGLQSFLYPQATQWRRMGNRKIEPTLAR